MFLNEEFIKLYEELSQLNESKEDTQKLINFAGEDLANRFLAIKKRLKSPENDLYYWIKNKTVAELEQTIIEVENTKSRSRLTKDTADQGAELVGENEDWRVYHITTFEAAQKYGRDTQWCITGINDYGDNYWRSYTSQGVSFYFYITKKDYDPRGSDSKFALALFDNGNYEIYDQQDDKVHKILNAPEIDFLPSIGVKAVEHYVYSGGQIPNDIELSSIKKVTITEGVSEIEEYAFADCTKLTEIIVPDSVVSIGDFAFAACWELSSIHIPDSVTFIGQAAFRACNSLKQITIPDSVVELGEEVFSGCYQLEKIYIGKGITKIPRRAFCYTAFKLLDLPKTIVEIGEYAYENSKIENLIIPAHVKVLGACAFRSCDNLVKAEINTDAISPYLFMNCGNLTKVVLGKNVTKLTSNPFENCHQLYHIVIPRNVKEISKSSIPYNFNRISIHCQSGSRAEQFAKENNIRTINFE